MPVARRVEDLLVWQIARELHLAVYRATNHPPSSRDFKFTAQIRDASESVVRNVAEGFGRYNPPVFAQFLDHSRASAEETRTLLRKGLDAGYWDTDEFEDLNALATRALQSIAKFQRYLRSPTAKRNAAGRYQNVSNG